MSNDQKVEKKIDQKKNENGNAKKLMAMIKNAYGKLNILQRSFKTTRF